MISFAMIYPEALIALAAMILLLWSAFRGEKAAYEVGATAFAVIIGAAALLMRQSGREILFHDMFVVSDFTRLAKGMILAASGAALLFAPGYSIKGREPLKPEYFVLILLATLGMMLMVSAHDLIALYMGLELQNLALYVLVSIRRDEPRASEAGLKYFTLGALSSALLLFGLSLIYGFAGATSYEAIVAVLARTKDVHYGLLAGLGFALAGMAFKISAAPFHMWTPDVYEGSSTPVTAFLSAAPKIAAFGLMIGLLGGPFNAYLPIWSSAMIAVSILSMFWGSLGGLPQTDIKRLIGYSAIANMGTILIGLVVLDVKSVLVYLAVYALGTLGVLGCVTLMRRGGAPVQSVRDLAGLSQTHPVLAVVLAGFLFSLVGVPPLAGFFGKFYVLMAAINAGKAWLAIVGVLASVIAAAYYLRLIKIMYFDEPKGLPLDPISEKISPVAIGLLSLGTIGFVIFPSPLIEAADHAAKSLFLP